MARFILVNKNERTQSGKPQGRGVEWSMPKKTRSTLIYERNKDEKMTWFQLQVGNCGRELEIVHGLQAGPDRVSLVKMSLQLIRPRLPNVLFKFWCSSTWFDLLQALTRAIPGKHCEMVNWIPYSKIFLRVISSLESGRTYFWLMLYLEGNWEDVTTAVGRARTFVFNS